MFMKILNYRKDLIELSERYADFEVNQFYIKLFTENLNSTVNLYATV